MRDNVMQHKQTQSIFIGDSWLQTQRQRILLFINIRYLSGNQTLEKIKSLQWFTTISYLSDNLQWSAVKVKTPTKAAFSSKTCWSISNESDYVSTPDESKRQQKALQAGLQAQKAKNETRGGP